MNKKETLLTIERMNDTICELKAANIELSKQIAVHVKHIESKQAEIDRLRKLYNEQEDEKVYFFEPLEKEISVEDMQKIVDANEKLVKEMKDADR